MKKRNKVFLITSLLSAFCAVCTCMGVVAIADETQPPLGLEAPLTAKVAVGELVTVPAYYVESNGERVKATANIVMPNGTVYSGSKFTVQEAGLHVVEYVVNGKVVHSEKCTAVIGGDNLLSVNALASVEGIRNYAYENNSAYKGVAVDVKAGGVITFDKVIDMGSMTKDDLLFDACIESTVQGEVDFKQMILTFTDVEDDSSYFKITVTEGNADGNSPGNSTLCYVNTGANGQTAGGYVHRATGSTWQASDIYGTVVPVSMYSKAPDAYEKSLKLYYDAQENQLFVTSWEGRIDLVADYDDPVVFGGTVWSGFESGKARLTVSFTEMKSSGTTVLFHSIAGVDLSAEEIEDNVAPTLTVDLGGQSKAPSALLGTEYKVFPCYAEDFFDSNVKIDTSVTYKNLATGAQSNVYVQDGKFVTDKLGEYTIKYVATDYSGNKTEKEVSFGCIASADEIVLTGVSEDFSANVFETVALPELNTVKAFGGCGDLKLTAVLKDPDGNEVVYEENSFVPQKLGKYQVIYTATDYYGVSESASFGINVGAVERTVFLSEIVLPNLLVKGFKYTIPQVAAKACYGGEVMDCKIDYIVNGTTLDASRAFTADGATANVICRAYTKNNVVCGEISKTVTVVDGAGGKDQEAYFYDKENNVTVNETKSSIDLTTSVDSSVEFVNKLKGGSFSLGIDYKKDAANYKSFNVTLIDAEKSGVTLTFKLEPSGDGMKITAPYGTTVEFPCVEGYLKLNYDSASGIVSDANGVAVTYADKDDAGNPFEGFANGLYAKFSFNGVSGESTVSLSSLNNQSLGYREDNEEDIGDNYGPEIEILGELVVKAKIGETVTIYACRAYDVLSQIESTTVRVQLPSAKVALAETAADKNYELKVTEAGYYKVTYTAYDTAGQRTRVVRNIRVVDSVAPTLSVDFQNQTLAVGSTVTLPSVTASDDSGKVNYDIFVALPNSEMRLVLHSENGEVTSYLSKDDDNYSSSFKVSDASFKLEMKGKYVITVMAYDADFNITKQSFTVMAR